jgi:AcrR family transcriptional regulator
VRTALVLLDEVGLDGLTVRRLADALGVQNPALYWHFKNKQELLDRMAATMLHDAFGALEEPVDLPWPEWLMALARAFRQAMLSHRDGARVLASADLVKADLLPGLDRSLRVLLDAGFTAGDALFGILAVFDYTMGATFEQQSDPVYGIAPPELAAQRPPIRERVAALSLPTLAAVLEELYPGGREPVFTESFERGLALILDGLRSRLPRARR